MKKVLLVGAAALLVLGCATTSVNTEAPVAANTPSVMQTDVTSTPAPQPALVEYNTKVQTPYRLSEHQKAVVNANQARHKEAMNTSYWSVNQAERSDSREAQLKKEIEKKAAAMVMGDLEEPAPTIHDRNNKYKKDAVKDKVKKMTESMNTLNEGGPSTADKYRTDLTMDDLNKARMPGNGLCSGTPKRTYLRASECRNGSCLNQGRTPKSKLQQLGNPIDNP